MKLKKTKTFALKDLREIKKLYYNAYVLQNKANVILSENFDFENNFNNEFYKVWSIDTSTNLYKAEIMIDELINKLIKNEN